MVGLTCITTSIMSLGGAVTVKEVSPRQPSGLEGISEKKPGGLERPLLKEEAGLK